MKYLQNYEEYNVQDIMSYPTTLSNMNEMPKKSNAQDMMTIPTSVTKDRDSVYTTLLKPYYDFMVTLTEIEELSEITYEQLDEYVGFSFIAYYMKVMILCDKEKIYILINGDLIPLSEPKEILEILEKEK